MVPMCLQTVIPCPISSTKLLLAITFFAHNTAYEWPSAFKHDEMMEMGMGMGMEISFGSLMKQEKGKGKDQSVSFIISEAPVMSPSGTL